MSLKVLLADDHKIVRDGLRTLLQKNADIEVIAEAEDGRETVHLVKKLSPEIVVMDIAMPDLNGIEATRQIMAEHPGIKIIALSMHSDKRFVMEMLKAGASAYLLKDCAFEELILAIRAVTENKTYLSPGIAGVVVEDFLHARKEEPSVFSVLTDREREVLQLLAEGQTTKEIASHLQVSIKTIETHRNRIMDKLGIHTIAELTKYAIREGLTSL
ncbi:MAG: response regulator transcription factor [Alphaproteobacteria bacterium]|uniref:Response regulator transcription factor n=1 Tax=Candidatus Nitrobium versatile TaxID=2884831 RepID=A0A953JAW6_9BACT|nr:response regulator transcription factor [Candidatus Nitrobium versatile]